MATIEEADLTRRVNALVVKATATALSFSASPRGEKAIRERGVLGTQKMRQIGVQGIDALGQGAREQIVKARNDVGA